MKILASLVLGILGILLSSLSVKMVIAALLGEATLTPLSALVTILAPLSGGALLVGAHWLWVSRDQLGLLGGSAIAISLFLLIPAIEVIYQIQFETGQGPNLTGIELAQLTGAFGGAALVSCIWLAMAARSERSPDKNASKFRNTNTE